jgi:hypothetical protein
VPERLMPLSPGTSRRGQRAGPWIAWLVGTHD